MSATHAAWTVDMLDALEDDGQRYELIDGELFVTPAPAELHPLVVLELLMRLNTYVRRTGVGRTMVSPADVRRGDRARNRVQRDVFVLRLVDGKRPPYPYELRDLMLAIEVASPNNPRLDFHIKRELYLREGVNEYWAVNPDARNVSVWRGVGVPGALHSKRISWQPDGANETFELELEEFFSDALR